MQKAKGRERSRPFFSVIASQRVGAKRRPMTGSAKQSIVPQPKYGSLRRFAPRNDDQVLAYAVLPIRHRMRSYRCFKRYFRVVLAPTAPPITAPANIFAISRNPAVAFSAPPPHTKPTAPKIPKAIVINATIAVKPTNVRLNQPCGAAGGGIGSPETNSRSAVNAS